MPHRSRTLAAAAAALSAGIAEAQAPAYLAALTIPPAAVGSCLPAPTVAPASGAALRGHRIVMTTRSPGARRDLAAYVDAAGRVARYREITHRMTGPTSSVGETVVAQLTRAGRVEGTIYRSAVTMPAPPPGRMDSAALRAVRERAQGSRRRQALGARERAQVEAVAAWLVRRCPG
jgi:hypothetical protein